MASGVDKAAKLIRSMPRVCIGNLRNLPQAHYNVNVRKGQWGGRKCGRGNKGQGQRNTLPRIGFEGGNTPFYLLIPSEPYYFGHHLRREYPPLTLLSLQRLVDLGRVDLNHPIDLTTLCNTKVIVVDAKKKHYGINLTDEGADIFKARVNIEVQWTNEIGIAAIERNGGRIITRFYDSACVDAMSDPHRHFTKGLPIPRCKLPPQDAIEYYSDANNRGYLADPAKIEEARQELAQKYGYKLREIKDDDPLYGMNRALKDPRQIWFGLEPGWAVNLTDKCILKPTDDKLKEYYKS